MLAHPTPHRDAAPHRMPSTCMPWTCIVSVSWIRYNVGLFFNFAKSNWQTIRESLFFHLAYILESCQITKFAEQANFDKLLEIAKDSVGRVCSFLIESFLW